MAKEMKLLWKIVDFLPLRTLSPFCNAAGDGGVIHVLHNSVSSVKM